MGRSDDIATFSSITQVSRETITSLIKYEEMLIEANKSLNLVGKSTINQIWNRHFLDSAQVIDFIDENEKSIADLGSGAGFPGMVLAILLKEKGIATNVNLIEKSKKKSAFLKDVIGEFKLNAKVTNQNVIEFEEKIHEDIIIARAFKPIQIILQLIHSKALNWKKILIFLGKTGNKELHQASKSWDIEYKQSMSVTSNDSSILQINKLKKR